MQELPPPAHPASPPRALAARPTTGPRAPRPQPATSRGRGGTRDRYEMPTRGSECGEVLRSKVQRVVDRLEHQHPLPGHGEMTDALVWQRLARNPDRLLRLG